MLTESYRTTLTLCTANLQRNQRNNWQRASDGVRSAANETNDPLFRRALDGVFLYDPRDDLASLYLRPLYCTTCAAEHAPLSIRLPNSRPSQSIYIPEQARMFVAADDGVRGLRSARCQRHLSENGMRTDIHTSWTPSPDRV